MKPPSPRLREWLEEFAIEHVETWFEFGDVGSFTVTQAQGDRPRVSWTVPTKEARQRSERAVFELVEARR